MSDKVTRLDWLNDKESVEKMELSVVDMAANEQIFLLQKGKEMGIENTLKTVLETDLDGLEEITKALKDSGKTEEQIEKAVAAAKILKDSGLDLEDIQKVTGMKPVEAEKTEPEKTEKKEEMEKEKEKPEMTEIEKALAAKDAAYAEEIKKAKEDAASAIELVNKMRSAEREREWLEKAKTVQSAIEKPEEIAAVLKSIADTDPEKAEAVLKAMKTASDRIEASELFKQSGSDAGEVSDIDKRVETAAKKVKEDQPLISIEKARDLVRRANPDWFEKKMI